MVAVGPRWRAWLSSVELTPRTAGLLPFSLATDLPARPPMKQKADHTQQEQSSKNDYSANQHDASGIR